MDNFDVIVVGGGLAGLSAAYCLAKEGIGVLVIERGDYSGAKNITGAQVVPESHPESSAGYHRAGAAGTFCHQRTHPDDEVINPPSRSNYPVKNSGKKPYHSYTVAEAKFDQWLADQ